MTSGDVVNAKDLQALYGTLVVNQIEIEECGENIIWVHITREYIISLNFKDEQCTPCANTDEKIGRSIYHVPFEVMKEHSPFFIRHIEPIVAIYGMK